MDCEEFSSGHQTHFSNTESRLLTFSKLIYAEELSDTRKTPQPGWFHSRTYEISIDALV